MVDFSKKLAKNAPPEGTPARNFKQKKLVNLPVISTRGGGLYRVLILTEPFLSVGESKPDSEGKTKKKSVYTIQVVDIDNGNHGIMLLHSVTHSELAKHYPRLTGLSFSFCIPAEKSPGKEYKIPVILELEPEDDYLDSLLANILPPATIAALREVKP